MNQAEELSLLKRGLARTWGPFFGRFGRLNPLQMAVIPRILAGENVIVSSPAATGKTEAAFAPLVERLEGETAGAGVRILYVSPTRALVNDIYVRLNAVLERCGLRAAVRTGDRPEYSLKRPEQVLFTTPESLDSMLCRIPSIWKTLRAVILDEIHLVDATYRGDQVRILLERIRREHAPGPLQYAALSATLYDPRQTALRYFQPVTPIRVEDPRPLSLNLFSGLDKLVEFLKANKMHKVLIFANSRRDVERLGTELTSLWPGDRIVIHHGSLSRQVRETSERALKEWRWGICIATMTLEIGIDIGDFDAIVCYRPPPTPSSFQQRVGRGCRREAVMQAIGLVENDEERDCFEIYAEMAQAGQIEPLDYEPDLSVAVQQLFSYLFSHPRGEEKETLAAILGTLTDRATIEVIMNHLVDLGYIHYRRERILATEKLMDLAEKGVVHSNIPSTREYRVIDRESGRQVGEIGLQAVPGTIFVLGGRVWETLSIKGLTLHARPIARKPTFSHFRKRSQLGAFSRFLPDSLKSS